jgi:hypothetical protein
MKKRSKRVVKTALSTLPLVTAGVTSAVATQAKPDTEKSSTPTKKPATPTFKDTNVFAIKDLSINPALPKKGETVTVTLQVVNESATPLNKVEWKLSGALAKTGTIAAIAAKSSHALTWKLVAPAGFFEITAEIDPSKKISEPDPLRRNNKVTLKSVAQETNTAWDGYASKAAARIGKLIESSKAKTSVVGKINGATLEVTSLKLAPIDAAGLKQLLVSDGLPKDLANVVVDAFSTSYKTWASKYRAAVPFAYPGLAAWPGPTSAPVPNVPFVLAIGGSAEGDKAVSAGAIEALLWAKLSATRKGEAGAKDAILQLSTVMAARFQAWVTLQQATGVIGKGSVPSFAPPYVPVGPVSMGLTEPAVSHLP